MGSGVLVSLPLEGLGKALLSQVLVPQLGEAFVFRVELRVVAVVAFADEAAPLLDAYIVIAPILCEAPGYVKWDEMRLVAFSEFTGTLNIVRLTVPGNVEGLLFECVLRTFRDAFRHTEGRFIK